MTNKQQLIDMIEGTIFPEYKEVAEGIFITKKNDDDKPGEFEISIKVKTTNQDGREITTSFAIWNNYNTDGIYIKNGVVDFREALPAYNKLATFLGVETGAQILVKKEEVIKEVVPVETKVEIAELKGKVEIYSQVFQRQQITLLS